MFNQPDLINLILAFVEGVGLITSPCILPILPIILSGSIQGDKKRPFGVVTGFILMFSIFTLSSRYLVTHLNLNLDILRNVSYALLILFGIVLISNYLSEKFNLLTQNIANIGFKMTDKSAQKSEFFSGLVFGSLIGLIWTPCAGPILAAALVQIATQETHAGSLLTLLFFALGSAVPMLLIILFSKAIVDSLSFFKKHAYAFRKVLGTIVILAALVGIYTNNFTIPMFNTKILKPTSNVQNNYLINGVYVPYPAPAIAGIDYWINSKPLKLSELKGKVVLIDFWTYSCINCIRTLPYLIDWDQKYRDKGLVIIGIHTPEFEFEKNRNNVESAVKAYHIEYPVAMDNQYVTWNNYRNHYWPAHYLINPNGEVVYVHFGEGEYDITENNIRYLLGLNASPKIMKQSLSSEAYAKQTPETYLGYSRAENFSGKPNLKAAQATEYTFPAFLALHHWALDGKWYVAAENIVSVSKNAAIKLHFIGKKIFAVIGPSQDVSVSIKVLLNGKPVVLGAGHDVKNSMLKVDMNNLYELLSFEKTTEGELTLIVTNPSAKFYTFTFG
ncbi:MAG: cytochrome c biogenesis protein DipZ [Gammaproteobacteria bacterium]